MVRKVQLRRNRSRHRGGGRIAVRVRRQHGSLHPEVEATQTGYHHWTAYLWISGGKIQSDCYFQFNFFLQKMAFHLWY